MAIDHTVVVIWRFFLDFQGGVEPPSCVLKVQILTTGGKGQMASPWQILRRSVKALPTI